MSGKSGSMGQKSDVKNCTDIFNYVESVLYPILLFAEDNRPRLTRIFKSTDLTIKHLNQLRLLGSIDKKVREMNREANRFLLSDTQTLLNSLIRIAIRHSSLKRLVLNSTI